MSSSRSDDSSLREIEINLVDTGFELLDSPSSTDELLILLENAESFLSKVGTWKQLQSSTHEALLPVVKGLVTNTVLGHGNVNIQVAAASCFAEISRICSPMHPYDTDSLKAILPFTMTAFRQLSSESVQNYSKALKIIETMAKWRSFILLLEIGAEGLVVEMFQIFLSNVKSTHPSNVLDNIEVIMTSVIEESRGDEISLELLKPLIESVKMDNKNTSPSSWELGKKVFENCAAKLTGPLREAVEEINLDTAEYAEIIASICYDSSNGENMVSREVELAIGGGASSSQLVILSEAVHGRPNPQDNDGSVTNLNSENSTDPFKHCKAPRSKRARKPYSLIRPEGKHQNVYTLEGKFSDEESSRGHSKEKDNSALVSELGNVDEEKSTVYYGSKKKGKRALAESSDVWLRKEDGVLGDYCSDIEPEMLSLEPLVREEIVSGEYEDAVHKMEEVFMSWPSKGKRPRKHMEKVSKEVTPTIGGRGTQLGGHSKGVCTNSNSQTNDGNAKLDIEHSLVTLKNSELVMQSGTDAVALRTRRRRRKPNSVSKPEEGHQHVWTSKCKYSGEASSDDHNMEKSNEAKGSVVNQHNHLETASMVESKVKEIGKGAPKKKGKRVNGESSNIRLDKGKGILRNTNLDYESVLSPQEQHERKIGFTISKPGKDKNPKEKRNKLKKSFVDNGERLINLRVQVWWPLDETYYTGTVIDFDPYTKKHKIVYDDDDVEILDLSNETWELLESEQPPKEQEAYHLPLAQQSVRTEDMATTEQSHQRKNRILMKRK